MKKLAFLVFAIVALAGCNSGNVSLSDIQKNAKENPWHDTAGITASRSGS